MKLKPYSKLIQCLLQILIFTKRTKAKSCYYSNHISSNIQKIVNSDHRNHEITSNLKSTWLNIRCGDIGAAVINNDDSEIDAIETSSTNDDTNKESKPSNTKIDDSTTDKSNTHPLDVVLVDSNNNDAASDVVIQQEEVPALNTNDINTIEGPVVSTSIDNNDHPTNDLYHSLPKDEAVIQSKEETNRKTLNEMQMEIINKNKNDKIDDSVSTRNEESTTPLPPTQLQEEQPIKNLIQVVKKQLGSPSTITKFSPMIASHFIRSHNNQKVITYKMMFLLSLLGSSLGFHSYLYFISVGFSVTMFLLSSVSLFTFNTLSKTSIKPILKSKTNQQILLVLLWSIRLTFYLLYREYISWYPQLHTKMKEMNQRANFYQSKFSIWLYVSLYYTLLYLGCFGGMIYNNVEVGGGIGNRVVDVGLYVACIGLVLESIADFQKSVYKQKIKNTTLKKWCDLGIWKYNTHPNYIGEVLFWIGIYISSLNTLIKNKVMLMGSSIAVGIMLFIMKTAYDQLSSVQNKTYGGDEEYVVYRERCESLIGFGLFGIIVLFYSLIVRFGIFPLLVKYLS